MVAFPILIILVAVATCGFAESKNAWFDPELVGKPADVVPWTFVWRSDLRVQQKPEANFIPRRLERLDRVYRTAYYELPQDQLKSLYYDSGDLLNPLPPKPKGALLTGSLWVGRLVDYQVELQWPKGKPIPSSDKVEVRSYPTPFGWFGWTIDRTLAGPEISADGRTWTYKSDPTQTMISCYNQRIPAGTEMVAVFCEEEKPAVPTIRIFSREVGSWKRVDIEIEWGFQKGKGSSNLDGRLEPYMAQIGPVSPLRGDTGTTMTGECKWRSRPADSGRRGIVVPLLYVPGCRLGLESRVTLWSKSGSFTFRLDDLDKGPILVAAQGVFISKVGSGQTARKFADDLAAKKLKTIRQMVSEHPEVGSWDELMREVRLWTCPDGTAVPPFPKVEDPPVRVQVPDERWTDAWRAACNQLRGQHLYGGLACEVPVAAHAMNLIGLDEHAEKVYDHFLASPGAKADGDFVDGKGALEWATSMRHDMGYSHDGTHHSTGRVLIAMLNRYFLSGDKGWLLKNRARLEAAADWIIRQRTLYLADLPNRKDLHVAGLMPPSMLGDYFLPCSDWHWYYVDNAFQLQGLQRFADALQTIDPEAARKYQDAAKAYRADFRRVLDREIALSPVRLLRDGMYHSFVPAAAYHRGCTYPELGAPQFPDVDFYGGAMALAEPYGAIDAGDPRIVDTIDVLEELSTYRKPMYDQVEQRKAKGLSADDTWFWHCPLIIPKGSISTSIHFCQDDVPGFLRSLMNSYAAVVGSNGKLWEPVHLGSYGECDTPDNGTAGWFVTNFRNMLVSEQGDSLWITRGTPRVWLEQGKRISVADAPSFFGTVGYEIVSDVDNGKIAATIDIPDRFAPKSVILRLRHPEAAPIRSVTINGRPWRKFSPDKETISLTGLTGRAAVVATY